MLSKALAYVFTFMCMCLPRVCVNAGTHMEVSVQLLVVHTLPSLWVPEAALG